MLDKLRFENTNIYDTTKNRQSNLQFKPTGSYSGSDGGVTVEFWLKKNGFDTTLTTIETLFDLWNGKSTTDSTYGRLRIELDGTGSNTCFRITCRSGSSGFTYNEIGTGSITNTTNVANNAWKHYAFTLKTSGSTIDTRLYVNGQLNDARTLGTSIEQVTGSLIANIGSLRTGSEGATVLREGYGKVVSCSFDDFRYWKCRRTEEQINRFYNTHVGGGTNTDDSNTNLGVYYKFNEGITTTSASE